MAGRGTAFVEAGYAFPKPLIDIGGKTMIEVVIENIKPSIPHTFVFVALREQCEKYDLYNVFKRATNNQFEVVTLTNPTQGAALTALSAIEHLNNDNELLLANADQYLDISVDDFIRQARKEKVDGYILTFDSTHPRWSYARTLPDGRVIEVAEKKVISNHATSGLYYYKTGSLFVQALQAMVRKNIRHMDEFYICPAFNEIILGGGYVRTFPIDKDKMHSMGTPEDLEEFQHTLASKKTKKMSRAVRTARKK